MDAAIQRLEGHPKRRHYFVKYALPSNARVHVIDFASRMRTDLIEGDGSEYFEVREGESQVFFSSAQTLNVFLRNPGESKYVFHSKCGDWHNNKSCPTLRVQKSRCKGCRLTECPGAKQRGRKFKHRCLQCNISCFDFKCVQNHNAGACGRQTQCSKCKVWVPSKKFPGHECYSLDDDICCTCKELMEDDHSCKVSAYIPKPLELIGVYDIETANQTNEKHLAVVICLLINDEVHTFKGLECIDEFMAYLISLKSEITLFAHNASGFDHNLVVTNLMTSNKYYIDHYITQGTLGAKVRAFRAARKITFRDSFHLISCGIAAFPKTFGFEGFKTFFPYESMNYARINSVGPYPSIDEYSDEQRKDPHFNDWYTDQLVKYPGNNVVLLDVYAEYCEVDVHILHKGLMEFRRKFKEITDTLNPDLEFDALALGTAASLSHSLYTNFFMENPDEIPVIDDTFINQVSYFRKMWLDECSIFKPQPTEIEGLALDHYDPESKCGFVYLDCRKVGCYDCFRSQYGEIIYDNIATRQVYQTFWAKVREAEKSAFKIYTIYHCKYVQKHKDTVPINIRAALKGGRTECFQQAYDGEFSYFDITSMYPAAMAGHFPALGPGRESWECPYPVGMYEYLNDPPQDIKKIFGVVDVTVTVPPHVSIPPLGIRYNDKFVFPTGTFRGMFCTEEIKFAMSFGACKVDEIHSAFHWEKTSTKLFKKFVLYFIDIKNKSVDNPGLRAIAKLILNTPWGKFVQRTFDNVTEIIHDELDYERMAADTTMDIDHVTTRGNTMLAHGIKKWYTRESRAKINIAIGIFTTAYGRMRLYEMFMHAGPENVLYCDTDSIFVKDGSMFYTNPTELGGLKDEWDGEKAVGWRCGGAKMYGVIVKGELKATIKGLTRNEVGRLTYNDMHNLATVEDTVITTLPSFGMKRREDGEMYTEYATKELRNTANTKRFFPEPFSYSKPFHVELNK